MSAYRNLLRVVVFASVFPLPAQDAGELFRQGERLFAERKPDAAIAAFQRAIEIRPAYAQSWKALGVVYASRQEFELAESAFRNACEQEPSLPDACLYYGRTLYLLNRFRPSIDVLHSVLERAADNSEAYRLLALSLEALGQSAEAGDAFRQSVRYYRASAAN